MLKNPCKICGMHEELPQTDVTILGIPFYVCNSAPPHTVYNHNSLKDSNA